MSLKSLAARLEYDGGGQLGRIKEQKLRSLRAALKSDYNSRTIKTPLHASWQCLINSNLLKSDYDRKIISVEYDSGLQAGDTFECLDDGTVWMVYLPMLTEVAYLRSEIVRCRYTLTIDDQTYWIYFQGPVETDIRWFQKRGVNLNELNLSGTIYIKKDERTKNFFKRFTHIKLAGHTWEVQVTDSITVPGIIELEIQEYYDNTAAELPEIVQEGCHEIIGKETVEQNGEYGYKIRPAYLNPSYSWSVEGNDRVDIAEVAEDGSYCTVKVHDGAIKGFKLIYGNRRSGYHMDVKIARECAGIIGPKTVYPYDIVEYKASVDGEFYIDKTDVAKIANSTGNSATVEILASKTNDFKVFFKPANFDMVVEYPVKIVSW